jgi:hypothetical protein
MMKKAPAMAANKAPVMTLNRNMTTLATIAMTATKISIFINRLYSAGLSKKLNIAGTRSFWSDKSSMSRAYHACQDH